MVFNEDKVGMEGGRGLIFTSRQANKVRSNGSGNLHGLSNRNLGKEHHVENLR